MQSKMRSTKVMPFLPVLPIQLYHTHTHCHTFLSQEASIYMFASRCLEQQPYNSII